MRLCHTEAARDDLERLLNETAERWPASLRKTIGRLDTFERAVLRFPLSGELTRYEDVRRHSLAPLPYVLFYRATPTEIEILRYHHTSRRLFDPRVT